VLESGSGGCDIVRLWVGGLALGLSLGAAASRSVAADTWGGSLDLTSDYFVRGISRTDDRAALQLDLHYLNSSGFIAGLFVSNTQFDPHGPRDAELDAYLGFGWSAGADWHGRILASHYAYPWNQAGSGYNYDELDVDVGFQDWVDITLAYSPNFPRYTEYDGLAGATSTSGELNLQRPVWKKLSAVGGLGYAHFDGPGAAGYTYWSVGASYDLAPLSLVLSYVDTSAGAKALFYNAAACGRWTGTVIWRF